MKGMYEEVIWPYWALDPPSNRIVGGQYKPAKHPTTYLKEKSLLFKVQLFFVHQPECSHAHIAWIAFGTLCY